MSNLSKVIQDASNHLNKQLKIEVQKWLDKGYSLDDLELITEHTPLQNYKGEICKGVVTYTVKPKDISI